MKDRITISGTGCCLVDQIYPDMDFQDPSVLHYLSKKEGDGGLSPGRLVLSEEFESFAGMDMQSALDEMTRNRREPVLNIGGPSIVALIHAAQLLQETGAEIRFYGAMGEYPVGEFLRSRLGQTPVNVDHLKNMPGPTPSTVVLSDPSYNKGHGERMFINSIGAAWKFGPANLDASFFSSDIVVFGGTAVVPGLHKELGALLRRSKTEGCITVVNTVYDFQSELKHPGERWKLGSDDESYKYIDLLITDAEEALRLSGKPGLAEAAGFFEGQGVSAFIITNGTGDTLCFSNGKLFEKLPHSGYPVSNSLLKILKGFAGGDTTGCGDNFVGGVLASMAFQIQEGKTKPDLSDSVSWGTVSGGYCCFHVGGTFMETETGEKLASIMPYYHQYLNQINA